MDLDQLEAFALATDRDSEIGQLIPGTVDYYYYSCLLAQQRGELDRTDELIEAWRKRHGASSLLETMENRQLVLRLPGDTTRVCDELRRRLYLEFDHQREVELARGAHPSRLDPAELDPEKLTASARVHYPGQTSGFTDRGLWRLLDRDDLDPSTRHHLLTRVRRPDHPKLVNHIAADMVARKTDFGAMPIHRLLLPEQLEALASMHEPLRSHPAWVECRLVHLQPAIDDDWKSDLAVKRAYLDRLWAEVKNLGAAFNSLKAHVLYHRLDVGRSQNDYPFDLFTEYLKVPRAVHYLSSRLRKASHDKHMAHLHTSYEPSTLLPPIGDDEPLVRDYLAELLVDRDEVGELTDLLDASVLRQWFAAIKILAGVGELERWHEMLDDSAIFAELKDRVDIELCPHNRLRYAPDEPVVVEARIKNVKTLIINVFEINTFNHALRTGREPDTTIDLDGLVASESHTYNYDEPPFRSVVRRFELPDLTGPGTYVVELLGGGKSSRALIRKGALRYTERLGAAGHVLTVYDEANQRVSDASIYFGGVHITADGEGEITVPFTTRPRTLSATLRAGDRTEVISLYHQAESYRLSAGIHVEREALIAGNAATIVVRPELFVSSTPISLSLLEEPALVIETTDRRGVSARREVRDLRLEGGAETTTEFRVPENLASISISLTGTVRSLTEQKDIELSDSTFFSLNGIDTTPHTCALHLGRSTDGYIAYVLGKSGEPRADMAINLNLHFHDFTDRLDVTLQTDERGRVELGTLEPVSHLAASTPSGVVANWVIERDRGSLPTVMQISAGETVSIPAMVSERMSLLEVRRGAFIADRSDAARQDGGTWTIEGLDAGDYDVWLPESQTHISLRVVPGRRERGWLLGERRHLEATKASLARITDIDVTGETIRVSVAGHSKRARLHVVATRFAAERSLWHCIGNRVRARHPRGWEINLPLSYYVSGRDLGDEYRYILERRLADKIPGAAVTRPGLLLNPWARQATTTTTIDAVGGGAYAVAGPAGAMAPAPQRRPAPQAGAAAAGSFANLDFLASGGALLVNLPISDGSVVIDRADLGAAGTARVLLVDDDIAIAREVSFAEPTDEHRDVRQDEGLDPAEHFSQVRQVSGLLAGDELVVRDIASSTVDAVDTLARVHQLYCALSSNATLAELGFITRWPQLDDAERLELYSKYACHELHLFLYFKDSAFFTGPIVAYLADKHHKTFLDHFFIDAPLERYLEPWRYGRLNTLERILLAGRLGSDDDPTGRRVRDHYELSPRDLTREQFLFDAVVGGGALDTGDAFGFADAKDKAKEAKKMARRSRSATGAMPPPMPASAPMAKAAMAVADEEMDMLMEAEEAAFDHDDEGRGDDGIVDSRLRDVERRREQRQLYRAPEKTQEWAENNYYKLRPHQQGPELIGVNGFWLDYAERDTSRPFLSPRFAEATSTFSEMMAALAVLDLPFAAGKHDASYDGGRMQLRADSVSIIFHKEIVTVEPSEEHVPVLVSQNYFRADDRYRWDGGEQLDKYVTGEMLSQVVYLCQVVLTNPTSSPKKLQLLLQIPEGSIAVAGGYPTRGEPIELSPYGTQSIEYSFYFPHPGSFPHYPAQVTLDEKLIASADARSLDVVSELSDLDRESWAHVSQHAEPAEVLAFLDRTNLARIDLDKIAWRMRDRQMFDDTLALLTRHRVYHDTLWSYSIHHGATDRVIEHLRHAEQLLRGCGPDLSGAGLEIEPIARGWYEHLEYAPLVNARAHRLGGRLQIANGALESQYRTFLERLAHTAALGDDEWLEVAYYLFLQDRVADALAAFGKVSAEAAGVQVDYMRAYAHLARGELDAARALAMTRSDHRVDRWRKRFEAVLAAIDRASGSDPVVTDTDDHRQAQDQLAATQASFEVTSEKSGDQSVVVLTYQKLTSCRVSYYLMDIELLFSRQPFLRENTDRFSLIRPNRSEELTLPPDRNEIRFDIPPELRGTNVVVEVEAGGNRRAVVHYAHRLSVQLIQQYGQVRVGEQGTGKPVGGTYVKVYARNSHGATEFYKDGYTDMTGSFDYASVSTDTLDGVERFALLLFDPERGSVIREAAPPPR